MEEAILSYVKEYPMCQTPDIMRALHAEAKPAIEALERLEADGRILKVTTTGPKTLGGWVLRVNPQW